MRRRAIVAKVVFFISIMIVMSWADMRYRLSSEKVANAQTLLFEMESDEVVSKAYVAYLGVRYPFYQAPYKEGYYALVPTGYYEKPKKTKAVIVRVIAGKKVYTSIPIMIEKGRYRSERLHVASSRATISKKNRARIKKESREAKKIYKTFTEESYILAPFLPPMESKITSDFGTKRVFNGVLKSYHSGTDFRAAVGVPIVAANRGKVVLVKNRFFAGNSIIIDHGQGIYTGYYHLSKFKVKKGDMVERGEVIGLAGATGRVTGPHLHFAVHVGGVGVDPMQFLALYNTLYE
jgi:murein DD-endopeptidase MepM/ murein hydrolase activator NlpD